MVVTGHRALHTSASGQRLPPVVHGRLQASEHRLLLLVGDAAAAIAGVFVALWTWSITSGFAFSAVFVAERAWWLLAVPAWMFLLVPAYELRTALSLRATIAVLLGAAAVLVVAYLGLYFYAARESLPRLVVLYFLWEAVLLTLVWRLIYVYVFTQTDLRGRIAILGRGAAAAEMADVIAHAGGVDKVVAMLDEDDIRGPDDRSDGAAGVEPFGRLKSLVHQHRVSQIVLAAEGEPEGALLQALVDCQEKGIDVTRMTSVYERLLHRVPIAYLESGWLFSSFAEALYLRGASRIGKRLVDLAGGIAGSVVFCLVLPFAAVAIWLDSGRPIFFSQTRTGRAGHLFRLLKFRTMVREAELDGPQWAQPNDRRVTRVGRLLRSARLDELPQFLNVLNGDMSLVGPRPERPEFVARLEIAIPFYRTRLLVRPGLTGWAQINCNYGDSVEDAALKLEYDLYYIKHRSLLFDAWILFRTIGTILRLRGI